MPHLLRKRVELTENLRTYQLRVDLPGLEWEDLKLRVEGDTLFVNSAKQEVNEEGSGYRLFCRAIPLPRDADGNILSARLQDGRLTVTLPRGHDSALVAV